ncbi:MAG: hypothetical protein JSS90_10995 [Bacteroidetes bacterium]|jgi:hypothetical protein|nr:hypothetical protein [Bacteroidota bacterium]
MKKLFYSQVLTLTILNCLFALTTIKAQVIPYIPENYAALAGGGNLEIFDVSGRCIYKRNLSMWSTLQQISLPDICEGLYNWVVTSGDARGSKKVAVIKE